MGFYCLWFTEPLHSIVAFATPPLFAKLRGGTYFLIVLFVTISIFLVIFVYRETAHCTLEELGEIFGDSPVDTGKVIVPDAKETSAAMVSMHSNTRTHVGSHMAGKSRGRSVSRSGMGMGMLGSVMESGVDTMPVHNSSPRKTQSRRGLAADEQGKGGASAMTSQATLDGSGSSMREKKG